MSFALPISSPSRQDFIGRARERSLVHGHLKGGGALLSLTGPSGIGKTRLATEVAAVITNGSPREEAYFCSLAGCESAADFEAMICHALGMNQLRGEELARALDNRGRLLLLLDNVNALAPRIADSVALWLERCPKLQILLTSLLPLEIEGEEELALGPMELDDAVALYFERAHRAWANRSLTREDEQAVRELVARLDRVPLAIELAAARVRILPPRLLLSRLERRFEFIGVSSAENSRSLLDALRLTWGLLDQREQDALALVSVFEGGFCLEAAVEIFRSLGELRGPEKISALLGELQSKSLIYADPGEEPRYHLYESVQDYARQELRKRGSWEEAIQRHASYYLARGSRLAAGERLSSELQWLRRERANLLSIHRRFHEDDPLIATRAGRVLAPLIRSERIVDSETHFSESVLDAARRCSEPRELLPALRLRASVLAHELRLEEAWGFLEEGVELARSIGERAEEAQLLIQMGDLHLLRGEWDKNPTILGLATQLAAEAGIPWLEAEARLSAGKDALARLSLREAREMLTRAAELFRRCGHAAREATVLFELSWVARNEGRLDDAKESYEQLVATARASGDRALEAHVLNNLGAVVAASGELESGRLLCVQALEIYRSLGSRTNESLTLANLGITSLLQGNYEDAENFLSDAEELFHEGELKRMQAGLFLYFALLEAQRGDLEEARGALQVARSYFDVHGNQHLLLECDLSDALIEVREAEELISSAPREARERVEKIRTRFNLSDSKEGFPFKHFSVAARLLEEELAKWKAREPAVTGSPSPSSRLSVGPDAAWFQWEGGEQVSLGRRQGIQRLFAALVERRLGAPGEAIDSHELFEAGWPEGEGVHPDQALRRLYFSIWTLRNLGLRDVLITMGDGYLLDPKVHVELRRFA